MMKKKGVSKTEKEERRKEKVTWKILGNGK